MINVICACDGKDIKYCNTCSEKKQNTDINSTITIYPEESEWSYISNVYFDNELIHVY